MWCVGWVYNNVPIQFNYTRNAGEMRWVGGTVMYQSSSTRHDLLEMLEKSGVFRIYYLCSAVYMDLIPWKLSGNKVYYDIQFLPSNSSRPLFWWKFVRHLAWKIQAFFRKLNMHISFELPVQNYYTIFVNIFLWLDHIYLATWHWRHENFDLKRWPFYRSK